MKTWNTFEMWLNNGAGFIQQVVSSYQIYSFYYILLLLKQIIVIIVLY